MARSPNSPDVSGFIDGTLTTNEIVYGIDANTVGSLAVATYPSLAELARVKGVTSAIQTQIDAKAGTTAPTFATSITGSYLTASEMLITNGSKNIVSAPVATYPSLTELTYLKGATSAVQTQIDAKGALAGQVWTGVHDYGGATSLEVPNGAAPTVNADGEIAFDTTVADFSTGVMKFFGNEEQGIVAMPVAEFTSPQNGDVVTYNSTTDEFELAQPASSSTVVTVQTPQPTQGVDGGLIAIVYGTNTTGYTTSYDLPFATTVNSIDIRASGTAGTAGTVDIGIYSEDGQTKLIDVTSGSISASQVYHIAVGSILLPAGRYYVVLVPNGTANVELNGWDVVGVNFGDTGEPVLVGTQTVTASTLPATFNPSSDVTFSNSLYAPLIRLNA